MSFQTMWIGTGNVGASAPDYSHNSFTMDQQEEDFDFEKAEQSVQEAEKTSGEAHRTKLEADEALADEEDEDM